MLNNVLSLLNTETKFSFDVRFTKLASYRGGKSREIFKKYYANYEWPIIEAWAMKKSSNPDFILPWNKKYSNDLYIKIAALQNIKIMARLVCRYKYIND